LKDPACGVTVTLILATFPAAIVMAEGLAATLIVPLELLPPAVPPPVLVLAQFKLNLTGPDI
jgi:hypothetical protein